MVQTVEFEDIRTKLDAGYNNVRNTPWYRDAVYDKFSDAEYQRRWSAVREKMAELGLDCIIAGGGPSHWSWGAGMLWLSGHWDWHAVACYVVFPKEGEPTLLYGPGGSHAEATRMAVSVNDVRATGGRFMKEAVERIKELGLENGAIGISLVDPRFGDYMPLNQYNDLREGLPNAKIEFLGDFFHQFVMIKSPEEQQRVAKAGKLCGDALRAIAKRAAPGVTEYELAGVAGGTMIEGGGQIDFLIIGSTPMSDPKMVFGNPRPSGRKLQKGDVVMMEIAAGYNGYTAQIGQPICLGEPPDDFRNFFDQVVLPGHLKMAETLKPGRWLSETQKAGEFFREMGYQSRALHLHCIDFTSSPPHVTTSPIPPEEDMQWQPGMTAMLEPNPITADGSLGLFFGHTYTITKDGHDRVTDYPLELTVVEA